MTQTPAPVLSTRQSTTIMSGGGLHHVQETEVTGSQTPNFDDWVKAASDDNHEVCLL